MTKELTKILYSIDESIIDGTISLEELKCLIFITYQEIFNTENVNDIVKDYLTLTFKHFIELENKSQQQNLKSEQQLKQEIVDDFTHAHISY